MIIKRGCCFIRLYTRAKIRKKDGTRKPSARGFFVVASAATVGYALPMPARCHGMTPAAAFRPVYGIKVR
ncbi:MAG: hypothetical protein ACFNT8_06360, partial [Prevotella sp.]